MRTLSLAELFPHDHSANEWCSELKSLPRLVPLQAGQLRRPCSLNCCIHFMPLKRCREGKKIKPSQCNTKLTWRFFRRMALLWIVPSCLLTACLLIWYWDGFWFCCSLLSQSWVKQWVHQCFWAVSGTGTLLRFDKRYISVLRKVCIISEGSWVPQSPSLDPQVFVWTPRWRALVAQIQYTENSLSCGICSWHSGNLELARWSGCK